MTPRAGRSRDRHIPVLTDDVLRYLDPQPGDTIVDATVGYAGHSLQILKRMRGEGRLICIDRDGDALAAARQTLASYGDQVGFFHADYGNFGEIMVQAGVESINGCLFDLGLSSVQIDDPERGFSYTHNGPLDMRMDRGQALTAYNVINSYSLEELEHVFHEFGDEHHADRIAEAIVEERTGHPIRTTGELARVFRRVSAGRKGTKHPEAPLFMAVRMEVNDELLSIEQGIRAAVNLMAAGRRLCVIAFHSGEDRTVKQVFKDLENQQMIRLKLKRPLTPKRAEAARNPRARSAKLRVAERSPFDE